MHLHIWKQLHGKFKYKVDIIPDFGNGYMGVRMNI